ncbi:MAG: phosphatidylglycerophosphatase A [Alphaproteobacteria bacterium]
MRAPFLRQPALPFRHPATLVSTWFGAGLLPLAPGTWGSLAALPFAWAMLALGSPRVLFIAALLAFFAGWWATAHYMRYARAKDPQEVVIDEVSAQWLTLVFADPGVWWHWPLGFLLFRFFDIVKPWPVNLLDRQSSALAVMADDTVAALYALVVFTVVVLFSPALLLARSLFGGS